MRARTPHRPAAFRARAASLVAALTLLAGWADVHAAPVSDVAADADWLAGAIFPDGAIAHYPDKVKVRPYLSHFGAVGLVHAYLATGTPRYIDATWRWLAWYQDHMDANGYVTDYDLVGGLLTSTGDMDSTDSYAGMFLVAAYNAHQATADAARTTSLRAGITKAVAAIESTLEPDGLTWSKPAYRVKYLMDQAESYAGLRAGAWLARNVLADPALATRAGDDATRIKAGVDALWNPAAGAYDWAKHDNGARTPTNWRNFYPDALQQVWAVAFGLVDTDPARADALLARFEAEHPNWDVPTATDLFDGVPGPVEYWSVPGWAFSRQGDQARADRAAVSIRSAAVTAGRAWPFHTMAAGQLLFLEAKNFEFFPRRVDEPLFRAPGAADTTAPSAPSLSASVPKLRKRAAVDLTWTAGTDDVGVVGYRLYRDGALLATLSTRTYRDSRVSRLVQYGYHVVAVDAAGNTSAPSNVVTVRA